MGVQSQPPARRPQPRPTLTTSLPLFPSSTPTKNAIRKKHEQLNYLKLASRLDAVVSRLDTQVGGGEGDLSGRPRWQSVGEVGRAADAGGGRVEVFWLSRPPSPFAPPPFKTQAKMQMVTKNMAAITKNLEKALAGNNLEKIAGGAGGVGFLAAQEAGWGGLVALAAQEPGSRRRCRCRRRRRRAHRPSQTPSRPAPPCSHDAAVRAAV
jgi:hypothetical protein